MKRYIRSAITNIFDEPLDIQHRLAMRSDTRPEMLDQLSRIPAWIVQAAVARNPNTLPETLNRLAYEPDTDIRTAVARHPNTPENTLIWLATRGTDEASAVAKNPNTPVDILRKLAERNNVPINIELAYNPKTPADILDKIADSDVSDTYEFELLSAVADNPSTSPETLDKLSNSSCVHYYVARNPNTPEAALRRILETTDEEIARSIAEKRLKVYHEEIRKINSYKHNQ